MKTLRALFRRHPKPPECELDWCEHDWRFTEGWMLCVKCGETA